LLVDCSPFRDGWRLDDPDLPAIFRLDLAGETNTGTDLFFNQVALFNGGQWRTGFTPEKDPAISAYAESAAMDRQRCLSLDQNMENRLTSPRQQFYRAAVGRDVRYLHLIPFFSISMGHH